MKYNLNEFLDEINSLICEVEQACIERKKGFIGDGNVQQLEAIQKELEKIKEEVNSGSLPPKEKRYTVFSRYIIDEWDLKAPLSIKLCCLADKYKRKI